MVSIKPNQSVINSFKILEAISNSSSYIGVSQLSKETSLPKTTVFRLLETLHYLGLIKQNDNQEYTLGRAFLKYIDKVKNQEDLVSISTPFLKEFASTVGETINLGILYNNEVIYLKSIRGERFTFRVQLLPVAPLYNSSLGKIFLSTFSNEALEDYIHKTIFEKNTINTIVDIDAFKEEINKVKKQNIAYDNEEAEYGLTCVALPIIKSNKVIAAISVSGPTSRLKIKGLNKIIQALQNTADNINHAISTIDDIS
ncbi:IclR family transcriptional regulator [Ligilactobacillus salivarius]|uniref:IclR family transcriptional regulator n=1 Tax=Ligilactobacillus salivarius TaxID=1624 RepID=UPI00136D77CA|nr:IclR family transcriptional regulator [Ligilactobacillus salivarius]MBE5067808.1 IclR family transcriptional regulator [Ligilactobacillus salivarius]MYU92987.1 IclR family transcriptional regulator [Ligilactobacillus salivarius]